MTLTQLEAFVLVARLGSVKAAARSLGVSEPAVSSALASLRPNSATTSSSGRATGMELTPGGRRLVPIASQMVGLAVEAEAAIRQAQGRAENLRIVATERGRRVGRACAGRGLLRQGQVGRRASLGVCATEDMAAVLQERLADVAIGPSLASDGFPRLECSPLFRYRLIFVASPDHHLASVRRYRAPGPGQGDLARRARRGRRALAGAGAARPVAGRPRSASGCSPATPPRSTAAEQHQGIAPAVAHVVLDDPDRTGLVPLSVRGTPVELLWHVDDARRRPTQRPPAAAFHRFVGTPAATHAMHAPLRGVPPSQFRPPVYVTIWN